MPTYTDSKDDTKKLSKEFYIHHPKNGIELYIGELTNRFAAFTGNVIVDQPLMDCTAAILDTLDRYMRKKETKSDLDQKADQLIASLRTQKNGDKFSKLFDEGEVVGNFSQSEKDAALCAIVAFRAGDDPQLIDAVFRKSALYREKDGGYTCEYYQRGQQDKGKHL